MCADLGDCSKELGRRVLSRKFKGIVVGSPVLVFVGFVDKRRLMGPVLSVTRWGEREGDVVVWDPQRVVAGEKVAFR